MALHRATAEQIPEGAIRLTKEEALKYQLKAIDSWQPANDMFALKHGSSLLAGVAAFTTAVASEIFRKRCKVPNSVFFAVGLPFATTSGLVTLILHDKYITSDLLLWQTPCLVCRQTRSALIMSMMGCIYPAAFTSFGNLIYADRMCTIKVPSLAGDTKAFFRFGQKMIQGKSGPLGALCAINVLFGAIVLYYQEQALFKLNERN